MALAGTVMALAGTFNALRSAMQALLAQIFFSSSPHLSLPDLGAHLASPAAPGGEAGTQQGASGLPRQQSATPQGIEL